MDDYSGKRAIDGAILSRKGSGLVFRDAANNRDQNGQLCNRLGCSGRVNSPRGVQNGCSEKGKSLRPSNRYSSTGKEVIGTSRAYSGTSNPRKSLKERKKPLPSHLEIDSSETGSAQDEPEVLELTPNPEKIQRGLPAVSDTAESSDAVILELGSSSVVAKRRSSNFNQRNGLHSQNTVAGSSIPSGSRNTGQTTHSGTNRYGLRNLRCNSVSDVIPPGCSSLDSKFSKRKNMTKKINHEGESSSAAQGKKITGSTLEGRNVCSRNGISISGSRQSRNTPPNRDTMVSSFRARRANSGQSKARLSNPGNEDYGSLNSGPLTSTLSHLDNPNTPLSLQVSSDTSIGHPGSYGRVGSRVEYAISPTSPVEAGITRSLMSRNNIRRFDMDGIAEVLLALERIEQDEELTDEQILVLETNLLLNSLTFYDQHRDLRLDIDNMSYEELLALEERMGTVSTALTEEALAECLNKSVYQSAPSNNEVKGCCAHDDDDKCSICQEEYVMGDEVGNLQCEHRYHVDCIQQWLRLKNWCPKCKASAAPSESAPPS